MSLGDSTLLIKISIPNLRSGNSCRKFLASPIFCAVLSAILRTISVWSLTPLFNPCCLDRALGSLTSLLITAASCKSLVSCDTGTAFASRAAPMAATNGLFFMANTHH